ncbi:aminoglycoside phosphotransferase family protein (plasmid) [Clavibacter michiganensis]|uniref:phosphotransferase enzyme family protein n=1 Tax=Clavibacter michiganensis TaxID=28447 RepID=UPI00292EFFD2|nr:aminoglycoside phosphotransferase family protein [Clavibacter michiganensis]
MAEQRVVVVQGDTVRRPRKPWTRTVHALLKDLHAQGIPVPEPRGMDERYEFVRFVRGDGGGAAWPHQTTDAAVASAGALMRRVHDASRSWNPPDWAVWSVPSEGGPVICHGDFQPGNIAWCDGEAVGLFDWDAARPAAPISDVAYALEWFAPFDDDPAGLRLRGLTPEVDRRARIMAFLEGYRWHGRIDVVDAVLARQQQAIDEVTHLGRAGHEPQATWLAAGWPEKWAAKLAVTESLRASID